MLLKLSVNSFQIRGTVGMTMQKIIDKLIPGSISDAIIWVLAIGAMIFLWDNFGAMSAGALALLMGQGDNKKRAEEATKKSEEASAEGRRLLQEAEGHADHADEIEEEIQDAGYTKFIADDDITADDVVSDIKRRGGL